MARIERLTEDEANAFLDEMFAQLFDNDAIDSDTDKVPDLGKLLNQGG